ncbi:hypothetical protein DMP17_44410 [Pseudonocardia sp. TMWB2A]|uniref:hypothetical protein n=1 Tax=Pseudonocardia sp. TMWB2A TaxID=687430 RepID=UPI00307DA204
MVTWTVATGFAALFWSTVASNSPHQGFDRLRNLDARNNVLPNWRFFAPNPAIHDTHVLYRTRAHDGTVAPWAVALEPSPRAWWNMVVYPGRRNEKAIFDVVDSIVHAILAAPLEVVEKRTPFRLLRGFVARKVRLDAPDGPPPVGFQIAIVRHTGYEDGETEYLMVSKLLPLTGTPSTAAAGARR